MKLKFILILSFLAGFMFSCGEGKKGEPTETTVVEKTTEFDYNVEQFADKNWCTT